MKIRRDPDAAYCVVLKVQDGRYFPKITNHGFVMQCEFEGSVQTTSAVFNTLTPVWKELLVWRVDGERLYQLKSYRSPIKLELFAIDKDMRRLDPMGYMMLDLRAAELKPDDDVDWAEFVCSGQQHKPQVRIAFRVIEEGMMEQMQQTMSASPTRARAGRSAAKRRPTRSTKARPAPKREDESDTESSDSDDEDEDEDEDESEEDDDDDDEDEEGDDGDDDFESESEAGPTPAEKPAKKPAEKPHHYRVTIELRSVTMAFSPAANLYLKYTYPHFGVPGPVMTNPPVLVGKISDLVLLPNAFTCFEFAMTPAELQGILESKPIRVEAWHKDRFLNDIEIGHAMVPLAKLLAAPVRKSDRDGRAPRTFDDSFQLVRVGDDGAKSPAGNIRVITTLEDLGGLAQPLATATAAAPLAQADAQLREEPDYQVAWELELWRRSEEQRWQEELKRREKAYMEAMADEWRRRERERAVAVGKAKQEYSDLEEKLAKALAETEARERRLMAAEDDLQRQRETWKREYGRKMEDLQDAAKRMQAKFDHELAVERKNTSMAELQRDSALDQVEMQKLTIKKHEENYRALDDSFAQYKRTLQQSSEAELTQENDALKRTNQNLEAQVKDLERSKANYKNQLMRALRELSRVKHQQQQDAEQRLRQEHEELERLRLAMATEEHQRGIKAESSELQDMRREVESLKLRLIAESKKSYSAGVPSSSEILQAYPIGSHGERTPLTGTSKPSSERHSPAVSTSHDESASREVDEADTAIQRLVAERDALLQAGAYTNDDRVIVGMDREIEKWTRKLEGLLAGR